MDYPCQICNGVQPRMHRFPHHMFYIGKISDLCRPIEAELLASQVPDSTQPVCNYAESINGSFEAADPRYGIFSSNTMLSYGTSTSVAGATELVEQVSHIRWAASTNRPLEAIRLGLKVVTSEQGDLKAPLPLVFPICARCSRLMRNYLAHRLASQPRYSTEDAMPIGYEGIYQALMRRFLQANKDGDHPSSLYRQSNNDGVYMLGRALVVQSVPDTEAKRIEVSQDIFSQIPSLPRWLMSKLQPIHQASRIELPLVNSNTTRPNPLVDLPNELVDQITWHFDRPTVMAFRLAHPKFARSLSLDQAFWCNELLSGEPPLFGFEPLYLDVYSSRRGDRVGRIDALSEVRNHFTTPRSRSNYTEAQQPLPSQIKKITRIRKREWQDYDWKALVKMLGSSVEFIEGGSCSDAPSGFCARRRLWGALDTLLAS